MQINLLFCSTDSYFLNQATNYISRTQGDIHVITYTNVEQAREFFSANQDSIDAVLADNIFFEGLEKGNVIAVLVDDHTNLKEENGFYSLDIYQQDEDLVRDLKKICLKTGTITTVTRTEKKGKIVSFYTIQGGSGQSTVAYQLAANLAMNHKVLFLSFDYENIYQTIYMNAYPVDLAQIIFQLKDKTCTKEFFYQAIVHNFHGLYVLPPFKVIGDLIEITKEDVNYLLEQILNLNEFDEIIIDLNHNLDEFNLELMQASDKIVSVFTADTIGTEKCKCFLNDPYIRKLGILGKMEVIGSKQMKQSEQSDGHICFPYISMDKNGGDIFHAAFDNGAFRKNCELLQERI